MRELKGHMNIRCKFKSQQRSCTLESVWGMVTGDNYTSFLIWTPVFLKC